MATAEMAAGVMAVAMAMAAGRVAAQAEAKAAKEKPAAKLAVLSNRSGRFHHLCPRRRRRAEDAILVREHPLGCWPSG